MGRRDKEREGIIGERKGRIRTEAEQVKDKL